MQPTRPTGCEVTVRINDWPYARKCKRGITHTVQNSSTGETLIVCTSHSMEAVDDGWNATRLPNGH